MVLVLTQEHLDKLKYLRTYPEWQVFQEILEDEINDLIESLINTGLSGDSKQLAWAIATQASINAYRRVLALPEYYELTLKINPIDPSKVDNQDGI